MSDQRLNIAYLCDYSPLDPYMYSGGNRRIHDALSRHVGDVTILSQGWGLAEPVRRAIRRLPDSAARRLRWRAHLALAPLISRRVEAELAEGRFDVLFCAYSFHSLLNVSVPPGCVTAFASDATHTIYRTSDIGAAYPSKFPGGRAFDGWVERCEARVYRSVDRLFWPSRWLKAEADALYGLAEEKSLMVPWGAGLGPMPRPAVRPLCRGQPLRLLLIGRDWFGKGGPIAFDTMKALRARGIDARLTVIGCIPPEFHRNEWVTIHPSLDKTRADEARIFEDAFDEAHFLVQPSMESYGFAFCEASAYGLPALCLDVGGVPVFDGENGHALPKGSTPEQFADVIEGYLNDPGAHAALSKSAREIFEARLNWDAWGQSVGAELRAALSEQRSHSVALGGPALLRPLQG
ncbi:glycosyltransferase family 4 protein [Salipiger sp. 1_MG-2023]|uniref:glycosyltransferase family 4 protein n=1 Tax=Salipiger sp. 1_MG-2023 TaxID=3062665 RepID=UPI0026E16010|nr:glycosyltransferase family 4 protein [Salipiger sp. 1_MG-2023]MDO6586309.1 glycosyltransferase family 4 protein [Salipiger sp. 1_MG-2023]